MGATNVTVTYTIAHVGMLVYRSNTWYYGAQDCNDGVPEYGQITDTNPGYYNSVRVKWRNGYTDIYNMNALVLYEKDEASLEKKEERDIGIGDWVTLERPELDYAGCQQDRRLEAKCTYKVIDTSIGGYIRVSLNKGDTSDWIRTQCFSLNVIGSLVRNPPKRVVVEKDGKSSLITHQIKKQENDRHTVISQRKHCGTAFKVYPKVARIRFQEKGGGR